MLALTSHTTAAYETGKGIGQNFGEALRWLSQSAEQGNADAQNLLGIMYELGEGVTQDYLQAVRWYRAACEHRPDYGGAGQGCNNAGLLYLGGQGVKQNRVQAYKYLTLGRNDDDLAVLKTQMSVREISNAEREIQEWLKTQATPPLGMTRRSPT